LAVRLRPDPLWELERSPRPPTATSKERGREGRKRDGIGKEGKGKGRKEEGRGRKGKKGRGREAHECGQLYAPATDERCIIKTLSGQLWNLALWLSSLSAAQTDTRNLANANRSRIDAHTIA